MYPRCRDMMEFIEEIAPSYTAEKWDNVGLIIGEENSIVNSILVALDINDAVIEEASENNCNLIICHHPVIFTPVKSINTSNFRGKTIHNLISQNINVLCAHTNLDASPYGTNSYLTEKLMLRNIELIGEAYEMEYGILRSGELENPITLDELCIYVKKILNINNLRIVGNLNRIVRRVAICSGDGADFITVAFNHKCDVLITGDIRYHDACDARDMGISIIDAGHFDTEYIYMDKLALLLQCWSKKRSFSFPIIVSKKNVNPITQV